MRKVMGVDIYNFALTNEIARCLSTAGGGLNEHIPVIITYCIGNGQVHDAVSPSEEVSKTLNCMCDPMKILIVK